MGDLQNGWFTRENPTKMDDNWGYPYFRKPPYLFPIWIKYYNHPEVDRISGSFSCNEIPFVEDLCEHIFTGC